MPRITGQALLERIKTAEAWSWIRAIADLLVLINTEIAERIDPYFFTALWFVLVGMIQYEIIANPAYPDSGLALLSRGNLIALGMIGWSLFLVYFRNRYVMVLSVYFIYWYAGFLLFSPSTSVDIRFYLAAIYLVSTGMGMTWAADTASIRETLRSKKVELQMLKERIDGTSTQR